MTHSEHINHTFVGKFKRPNQGIPFVVNMIFMNCGLGEGVVRYPHGQGGVPSPGGPCLHSSCQG